MTVPKYCFILSQNHLGFHNFSNFDLNGHFYEYGWSNFLRTFTNGFFVHKKIQDSTKINGVWCKIRYLVQNTLLRTPTAPLIRFSFFWTALSHFLTDFNKQRCQNAQEIILHQIIWYPKKFETWPLFCPCITDH